MKNQIIGERIKNIRLSRGMTLEKFGALFGAAKGNASKWEKGESLPNPERIKAIAEFANITIEELTSHVDNLNSPQIVGQKIKTIRLDSGLTMEQFGKLFNTSKGTVNNWEKGRNLPNKENLGIISEMGGQSVTELLNGNNSISLTISEYNRLKDIEQKFKEINKIISD
ncbi:helix-turn-helix domain-containing protein [Lactococcus protaetiae]|uniref:Helix-turn-helix transcriptional regulator n=1 Tax=Lactococcus protaetiae TaxID=2592653 RepID=A0A514ZA53_9LACT|nr:helix-turn-helix transcriptional regulator [Lactococcus protaetiae]